MQEIGKQNVLKATPCKIFISY